MFESTSNKVMAVIVLVSLNISVFGGVMVDGMADIAVSVSTTITNIK